MDGLSEPSEPSEYKVSAATNQLLSQLLHRSIAVREHKQASVSSPTSDAWASPFCVERYRGIRRRQYTVHVSSGNAGDPYARTPPKQDNYKQSWDLQGTSNGSLFLVEAPPPPQPSARITLSTVHLLDRPSKSTSLAHSRKLVADAGARPASRGRWPVLVAAGVTPLEVPKDRSKESQEEELQENEEFGPAFWMKHFEARKKARYRDCTLQAGQGKGDIRAAIQKEKQVATYDPRPPFRAGSPRPRIIERRTEWVTPPVEDKGYAINVCKTWSRNLREDNPAKNIANEKGANSPRGSPKSAAAAAHLFPIVSPRTSPRVGERPNSGLYKKKNAEQVVPASVRQEMEQKIKESRRRMRRYVSKKQRLSQVRRQRDRRQSQMERHADCVSSDAGIKILYDAFERHFAPSCQFYLEEMFEAVADFGLIATTREQKVVLRAMMDEFKEIGEEITANDFRSFIEAARLELRMCEAAHVLKACHNAGVHTDPEHPGQFDQKQIYKILQQLDLAPVDEHQMDVVEVMLEEMDKTKCGLLAYHDMETVVQQLREMKQVAKRERERELQIDESIPTELFQEHRYQVLELYESFRQLRSESKSAELNLEMLMVMLKECGCIDAQINEPTELIEKLFQRHVSEKEENKVGAGVGFCTVLQIMLQLRNTNGICLWDSVRDLFQMHDVSREGRLCMNSVLRIFRELDIAPANSTERERMAALLVEADVIGDDNLELDEVVRLATLAIEMLGRLRRQVEHAKARTLGFTSLEAFQLRQAFETLDCDGTEILEVHEVDRAVRLMGWRITQQRLQQLIEKVDDDDNGTLDFSEFLSLMRLVDDEMKAASAGEKGIFDSPDAPAEPQETKSGDSSRRGSKEYPPTDDRPCRLSSISRRLSAQLTKHVSQEMNANEASSATISQNMNGGPAGGEDQLQSSKARPRFEDAAAVDGQGAVVENVTSKSRSKAWKRCGTTDLQTGIKRS